MTGRVLLSSAVFLVLAFGTDVLDFRTRRINPDSLLAVPLAVAGMVALGYGVAFLLTRRRD